MRGAAVGASRPAGSARPPCQAAVPGRRKSPDGIKGPDPDLGFVAHRVVERTAATVEAGPAAELARGPPEDSHYLDALRSPLWYKQPHVCRGVCSWAHCLGGRAL